jgi:hypothetical protein
MKREISRGDQCCNEYVPFWNLDAAWRIKQVTAKYRIRHALPTAVGRWTLAVGFWLLAANRHPE